MKIEITEEMVEASARAMWSFGHDPLLEAGMSWDALREAEKEAWCETARVGLDAIFGDEPVDPEPEENFWDDRTTPGAYSQQDSERDKEARRNIAEKAWDEGWIIRANGDPVTKNPYRKTNG